MSATKNSTAQPMGGNPKCSQVYASDPRMPVLGHRSIRVTLRESLLSEAANVLCRWVYLFSVADRAWVYRDLSTSTNRGYGGWLLLGS